MPPRRRPNAKTSDADEYPPPPETSTHLSSDDDEANEDLSLAILETARRRNAQKPRKLAAAAGSPSTPLLLDPSSTSSDDALGRKKKKKKKRKKDKIDDAHLFEDQGDENGEQVDDGQRVEEKELITEQADAQGTQEKLSWVAESVMTIVNSAADNAVLRKLLRGPRYFDPGESTGQTCFNCNEEGHMAVNCPMEKRQKRCFICGLLGHNGKQCKQGQDCNICKRRGHRAKDCPNKQKMAPVDSRVCLRCGDTGHDMLSCRNDYSSDDMKVVQCYVCNQNGHLCCVDFVDASPKEVSCYNCAGSGHSGLGCAKPRGENNGITSPASCYKCGEEGHFARGCKKSSKTVRSIGESSTPHKHAKENIYNLGFKSLPNDFGKIKKRKNLTYEDGREMNNSSPKTKGGWIVDDPGDLHRWKFKRYKDAPPRTPVRKHQRDHPFSPSENFSKSKSYNKYKHAFGTPDYQSPSSSYQQKGSASRSANSHIRFW